MKRIIVLLWLFSFSIFGFSQVNTKVSGNILNANGSQLNVVISFKGPLGNRSHEITTRTGKFEYAVNIDEPSQVSVVVNNKFAFMPGVYYVPLEPGDNIHITIPEINSASFFGIGITKIKFSGRGAEKLNLLKSAAEASLNLWKIDPPYAKQSLTYKYESADRKLSVIDSVLLHYTGSASAVAKDILKATLYNDILDGLFISSLRSESDSLRYLFNKYIVDKNRMSVFFRNNTIFYEGYSVVKSYIMLCEFNNPTYVGGANFSRDNRISMAKMTIKYLRDKPIVRDYLLSDFVLSDLEDRYDHPIVKELYQLYLENVNPKNPSYGKVKATYDYVQRSLVVGSSFYNFSLPDPDGKLHHLTDFKGKVLIMDFWFNGCVGCKQMVPLMEELENEYKGKNVEFISVSIDKRIDWLDGIGKYSSKNSLQLYTEEQQSKHPFIKHLNFSSYPRLIVVDKNGNMGGIPPDPRSDKEGFKKFVNKYL